MTAGLDRAVASPAKPCDGGGELHHVLPRRARKNARTSPPEFLRRGREMLPGRLCCRTALGLIRLRPQPARPASEACAGIVPCGKYSTHEIQMVYNEALIFTRH